MAVASKPKFVVIKAGTILYGTPSATGGVVRTLTVEETLLRVTLEALDWIGVAPAYGERIVYVRANTAVVKSMPVLPSVSESVDVILADVFNRLNRYMGEDTE